MCGICGFVGAGGNKLIQGMMGSLIHRGPDEQGLWEEDGVALGMRRLAIIDVETGSQPIFNEDSSVVVVLNGEIYNFVELREKLISNGHKFYTDHSDTEVLVHLYEDYGMGFLDHLNGMFAIALWDKRRSRLVLARDRVGIKPIYYSMTPDGIAFASEPKALLVHPEISREPDREAIHHYFSLKNVPAPLSAFKAIKQLHPGESLTFENGKTCTNRWWRIPIKDHNYISQEEAAHEVLRLLTDSVRLQMRSDVPVGAYLSGGVDSSSVVALMARCGSDNLKTFTLVYEDDLPQKTSDREFAKQVSNMYGTEHHERIIRPDEVPQHLDTIIKAFDEPFSGVISTYFLTDMIAEHVKVSLSGDGADELFGSYLPHRLARPLADAEVALARHNDVSQLPTFEGNRDRLAQILGRGDEASRRMEQYIADDDAKSDLYTREMRRSVSGIRTETLLREIYNECQSSDPLNRALYLDWETQLPDQVLAFVDRLSMAHSVEVRPPFLDHRLIEFVANLPGSMKIEKGRVKSILKNAVSNILPDGITDRPKEGFVLPINEWILVHLQDFVRATLSADRLKESGILNHKNVTTLLDDYYAGEKILAGRVWNLVCFQSWWRNYQ